MAVDLHLRGVSCRGFLLVHFSVGAVGIRPTPASSAAAEPFLGPCLLQFELISLSLYIQNRQTIDLAFDFCFAGSGGIGGGHVG